MAKTIDFPVQRAADISKDGKYRYSLTRTLSKSNPAAVMFLGLYPNRDDVNIDSEEVKRATFYAQEWGYGKMHFLNLFAFRAANVEELKTAEDPIGTRNLGSLSAYAKNSRIIIACWGKNLIDTSHETLVRAEIKRLHCLATDKSGAPVQLKNVPAGWSLTALK